MPGNEVAQVHRYVDLGAEMEVCQASMDVICSSAIKDLQAYHLNKPVILAETGAVEPHHAGPSKYYAKDTAGILLHDILFAPFFTGSAGAGMSWHWESYVHKNNLWYHYGRFAEAIKGIDPVRESFKPTSIENDSMRFYVLKGKNTTLIWLRDKSSNWQKELEENVPARTVTKMVIHLNELKIGNSFTKIDVFDPWKNSWSSIKTKRQTITLPDFRRSLVIKVQH
jgi:hypothetical protein